VLKVLHPEDGAVVQALVAQVAEQVNTNIQIHSMFESDQTLAQVAEQGPLPSHERFFV
jgi:hypothetical protein